MLGFLGMLVGSGHLFYDYSFDSYCWGLFLATTGLPFLGLGIFIIRAGYVPYFTVITGGLTINYSVYEGSISGSILEGPITPSV